MKRLVLLAATLMVFSGLQFISNCADPLGTVSQAPTIPVASGTDTIYKTDTVIVVVHDSIVSLDSMRSVDTVVQIDTVFITEHDTCSSSQMLCSKIESSQKEIIWMFRNPEGTYRLEFMTSTERDQPIQTVNLNIDGQDFKWSTAKNPEFTIVSKLKQDATIRISSDDPKACGHAIFVCLKLTKL